MSDSGHENRRSCVYATAIAAALLYAMAHLLAAEVRGDNRPLFEIEYGECDQAIEQWGRAALFSHFSGQVWEDFTQRDPEVLVVSECSRFFYNCTDPGLCLMVVVKNPGWRGRRGDQARIQWQPDRWAETGDPAFKMVQLRTLAR